MPRTSSAPSRLTAALVGALGLLLMITSHVHGDRMYLRHLDTDRTLYHPPSLLMTGAQEEIPPGPASCRRLWIVVLDGLRDDIGDALPNLRRLGTLGVRRTLLSEYPTFTFANLTTLTTGVVPALSGVRLNSGLAHVRLDTLLDDAARAGVRTLIATQWPGFDQALDRINAPLLLHLGTDVLRRRPPAREIAWVHFDDIDQAGHRYGAASPHYLAAAQRGDALVGALFAALDPARDVLVVVSDHGHRARGGHGGIEPEVRAAYFLAVGAHVRSGVRLPPGRMRDVCATLALLSGLPPPRDNLGMPMLDVLDLLPAELARSLAPTFAERGRADAAFDPGVASDPSTSAIRRSLLSGDASAVGQAQAQLLAWESAREGRMAAQLWQRERRRLFWAGGILLLIAGALLGARCSGALVLTLRDLGPLAFYLAVFFPLYLALGYSLSWSIPHNQAAFIIETGIIGMLGATSALLVGRIRFFRNVGNRRRAASSESNGERGRVVEQCAATVALLWAIYVLCSAAAGLDPAWLAGPRTSFGLVLCATVTFYIAGVQAVAAIVRAARP